MKKKKKHYIVIKNRGDTFMAFTVKALLPVEHLIV